jgi:hypothetical protein
MSRLVRPGRIGAADIAPGNGTPAGAASGQEVNALDALVEAREATHSAFADTPAVAQALKSVFAAAGAARFEPVQREALDQIAVKLARILAGDPGCADHWRDLAEIAFPIWRSSSHGNAFRSLSPSSRIARSTSVSGSGAMRSSRPSHVAIAKSSRRSHTSRTTDARRGFNLAGLRGGARSASIARLIRAHTSPPSSSPRSSIKS